MQKELLDPKIDFVFKQIFGCNDYPEVVVGLLNAILTLKSPIKAAQILERPMEKNDEKDKVSIITIRAITEVGEKLMVEIWLANQDDILRKDIYNLTQLYNLQVKPENNYKFLGRTIYINLLNFKYIKDDKMHHVYRLKEVTTHEQLSDFLELHFLEMPKHNENPDPEKPLTAWIEFLKEPNGEKTLVYEKNIPALERARKELMRISNNDTQRMLYQMRLKMIKDEIVALKKAKKEAMEQGMQKGMQRGMEQGIQKGIKQGIQQGMLEEKKKIAMNLIKAQMSDEQIMTITGLEWAIIAELRAV